MDVATETAPVKPLTRFLAGLQAGMLAVIVMLGWLGLSAMWHRHTFWKAPNEMATVLRGNSAIGPGFAASTWSGIALYVLAYSLLGALFALAAPRKLTVLGLMLIGVLVSMAWYVVWFRVLGQSLMPLVWLLHEERPMEFAHVLFGVMLARFPVYLEPRPKPAATEEPAPEVQPEMHADEHE
jgi:hypothetical protein